MCLEYMGMNYRTSYQFSSPGYVSFNYKPKDLRNPLMLSRGLRTCHNYIMMDSSYAKQRRPCVVCTYYMMSSE